MKRLFAVCLFLASAGMVFAQTKNPVTSVVKDILARQQKNITAAIEEMPAAKFDFKPTPDQMSFGHLAVHIAESNNYFCSTATGMAEPKSELKETDGKDKLLAAVKESFAFCKTALDKVDDSKLSEPIKDFGGHEQPRAWALIAFASSCADHYGAAAMYLRLNGLLPPTAHPKK
ncbi:MAG: DinB family protein [Terriglobales bacterium]